MKKNSYSYDELINCGEGKLFGPGNAKLPLPPMLMFDRITEITDDKGAFNKPFLKVPLLSLISVILSNISIGGRGNLALPGPNNFPSPQFISSSYE